MLIKKNKKPFPLFLLLLPVLIALAIFIFSSTTKTAAVSSCETANYTGMYDPDLKIGMYDGQDIKSPSVAKANNINSKVLGVAEISNRWIEVDLSEQKLKAWDGNTLFFETLISTGMPWTPTPVGEYRVWVKLRYTRMSGGSGRYAYNLPNVPFVMYFEGEGVPGWKGYGLHGTYWHNDFGRVHSHGCVNLPTPMAEKLYYWVGPVLPSGKVSVFASPDNPGTRIVIHE